MTVQGLFRNLAAVLVLLIPLFGYFWYIGLSPRTVVIEVLPSVFRPNAGVADVKNAQKFERPAYSVSYPGNWHVDVDDEDYDPDSFVDIDASGQGAVMLRFLKGDDPMHGIQYLEKRYARLFLGSIRTAKFSQWGQFEGIGVEMIGTITVVPGRIRLFAHKSGDSVLVVSEIRYDEDEEMDRQGYELVSESFHFK